MFFLVLEVVPGLPLQDIIPLLVYSMLKELFWLLVVVRASVLAHFRVGHLLSGPTFWSFSPKP